MSPARALANEPGSSESALARLYRTTRAPDYIGLIILLVAWVTIDIFVTPFHRMFSVQDLRIAFPFAEHERVSVGWNFVYALFAPLGCLFAYNVFSRSPLLKHEATYLSFLISVTLSQVIVDIIKNAVGRPRPDLLARCRPSSASQSDKHKLFTIAVCAAKDSRLLQDGWRSFPSGHASFSFAGLGFLSLFLAGQLHIFDHATARRNLGRDLVCVLPVFGALMISISRCQDYRHDVYDVTIGGAIGMIIAYWSYRRYWPGLSSSLCHEPRAAPSVESAPGWQRVRDEEEAGIEAGAGAVDDGYSLDTRLS